MPYRVQIVWADGDCEFIRDANDQPAEFRTKADADYWAESFRMGMDDDEVQSISVIRTAHKRAKSKQ